MPKPFSVRDYMSANLVTFTPDTDILNAISQLVEKRISGAPVLDKQGNLVGIVSEKDCLRVALHASYHAESAGTVSEYMHTEVKTVNADTGIVEVARMFLADEYRRYPVIHENRLVGQISRRDALRALASLWE
ncbi:MAG: CBS domain-containing protein [Gammaproteobacteria bacterium]|nr:CBS domain-containing protein [Gammaproteobacteria bacterium]